MLTPEQIEQLEKLVRDIANGVYNIALKQVYIDAVLSLIFLILALVVFVVLLRTAYKNYFIQHDWERKQSDFHYGSDERKDAELKENFHYAVFVISIIGTAITFFPLLFSLLNVQFIVTAFLNPNWILIQRLIQVVK